MPAYAPALTATPALQPGALLGLAVDGKTLRGSLVAGRYVHLLSLAQHGSGCVPAQQRVASKSNEIVAAPTLLAGLNLQDCVITADALLTQRPFLRAIRAQGGDYLLVVKENQPALQGALAQLTRSLRFRQVPRFRLVKAVGY